MSERDLRRIAVLSEVISERRTIVSAASVLAVSVRHVHRLLDRFEAGGGASLAHRARGRAPNNGIDGAVEDYAIALIREKYLDFGPTLAAEMLVRHHGLTVSRETLRKWMVQAGIWLSRKQRRSFHQPRLRREAFGELIQIDGSEHRWFEARGDPCTLLVFIDDATGRLMQLRFVSSESTASYFEALKGYLVTHGCPVAFYSDKHTVFRVSKPDTKGGQGIAGQPALPDRSVCIRSTKPNQ
jgi:transposase